MNRYLDLFSTGRKVVRGVRTVFTLNDAHNAFLDAKEALEDTRESLREIREDAYLDEQIRKLIKSYDKT